MELAHIQLCLDVARLGSFASAARELNLDPSKVSRQVMAIEDRLGFQVFQRNTRNLNITDAGRIWLTRMEPLLEDMEAARDAAASLTSRPQGVVRLTTSVAFAQYCLAPLLPDFAEAFPDLHLDILTTDQVLDFGEDNVDLAIRMAASPRKDVIGTKLMRTRYRVLVSDDWLRAHAQPADPMALQDMDCLLLGLPGHRNHWHVQDSDDSISTLQVRGRFSFSGVVPLKAAALQGLGPALLADWMTKEERDNGDLVDLFPYHRISATDFDTAAWLLYASKRHLPHRVRVVIDFLKQAFQR